MKRGTNPEMIDDENPEWTKDDFRNSVPVEGLSKSLQTTLRRGSWGPQKLPTKERITIRLSREVVDEFRETGPGWQTRVDAALKDWLRDHRAR